MLWLFFFFFWLSTTTNFNLVNVSPVRRQRAVIDKIERIASPTVTSSSGSSRTRNKSNRTKITYNHQARVAAKDIPSEPSRRAPHVHSNQFVDEWTKTRLLRKTQGTHTASSTHAYKSDRKRLIVRKGPISKMSGLEFRAWLYNPEFDLQANRMQIELMQHRLNRSNSLCDAHGARSDDNVQKNELIFRKLAKSQRMLDRWLTAFVNITKSAEPPPLASQTPRRCKKERKLSSAVGHLVWSNDLLTTPKENDYDPLKFDC